MTVLATSVTNRHELRRRATRAALRETALEMFARRGFDDVTVSEIADEVGVTERTFYRHFPTKEAVLFQDYEDRLDWLAAALKTRPATESMYDSVLVAVATFPHDLEIVRQASMLRTSLISGDRVADHMRIVQASFAAVLTDFLRARYADHPDAALYSTVAGNVLAAALVAAVNAWGEGGCVDDVAAMTTRAVDYVRTGLDPDR